MTIPSGNGETRGPEAAGVPGTPAPSRPARARANDAKHADFLGSGNPKAQDGLGTEDMQHSADYLGMSNEFWSDAHDDSKPVDLGAMGNAGQTFGDS